MELVSVWKATSLFEQDGWDQNRDRLLAFSKAVLAQEAANVFIELDAKIDEQLSSDAWHSTWKKV